MSHTSTTSDGDLALTNPNSSSDDQQHDNNYISIFAAAANAEEAPPSLVLRQISDPNAAAAASSPPVPKPEKITSAEHKRSVSFGTSSYGNTKTTEYFKSHRSIPSGASAPWNTIGGATKTHRTIPSGASAPWNTTGAGGNNNNNGGTNHRKHKSMPSSLSGDRRSYFASTKSKYISGKRNLYDWRDHAPTKGNWISWLRWFIIGGNKNHEQSDEQFLHDLSGLARCLLLLREYLNTYGMPEKGGPSDQDFVLREAARDLYAGGAPLWALENVMQKASEGLTGCKRVNWCFLPRKAFVCHQQTEEKPGQTSMFKIDRGFTIRKLDAMEAVIVRLASFASNTAGASNIPTRFPTPEEFNATIAQQLQLSVRFETSIKGNFNTGGGNEQDDDNDDDGNNNNHNANASSTLPKLSGGYRSMDSSEQDKNDLAEEILDLASGTQGLFFYINSKEYEVVDNKDNAIDPIWMVDQEERECFCRLACIEAMKRIEEIDKENKEPLYNPWVIILFRVVSSAGACGFWFNGSWIDMLVAGLLAVVVAWIGESPLLSGQEKIIFEAVASFIVGAVSGMIAFQWPDDTCYSAMAISGVLDLLQGFRVVYAIVEVMSRNTVAGGADFLEGILFTGLIAYFLRFGQYFASSVFDTDGSSEWMTCDSSISEWYYFILVPLASISWSGLFTPNYDELLPMGFHGALAYAVNYGMAKAGASDNMNNFISAMCITFSAGIFSRFTGRQAVGNTVAGLYSLLPGAYLVRSLYSTNITGSFFSDIIQKAIIIGIGSWTGTLLCSPTLLSTTKGLISQQHLGSERNSVHVRDNKSGNRAVQGTMLFF